MGKIRVLIDTNIVLDFFSGRMNDGLAAKLIQLGRTPQFEMCISFLTAINTMYVAKKIDAPLTPNDLPKFFTILPQDFQQWTDASSLQMSDFEDAVQASCALNNDCFIIVSRDHHFQCAPMSVMSPEQFLSIVCQNSLQDL